MGVATHPHIVIFMIYCNNKEMDKAIRLLVRRGWQYRRGKKHGVLEAPSGGRVVVSVTPSCPRTYKNFIANIRSAEKERHEQKTK